MRIGPTTKLLRLAADTRPAQPNAKAAPATAAAKAALAAKSALAAKTVLAVVDQFVIPAYRALAQATDAQEKEWTAFAAKRDSSSLEPLYGAYNAACDAWANVQIVKTGPTGLFLRAERFAYWPEARNVTQRTLDALIAANDPKELAPDKLARDSVAAQGLTALERLLYDNGDKSLAGLLKAPGQAGQWRTQVGQGIAHNLNLIAKDVLAEWTATDGVRAAIAANTGWKTIFADAPEGARLLLTDLVAGFKLMHDVKLLPVLGANADAARPALAEAWRSGRSQRDLALNLEAAHAMTKIFAEPIPASHKPKIEALYATAAKAIDAVPADLGAAAADKARRPRVEAVRAAIKAVQVELAKTLPADLGITLGFNSLDGD